MKESPRADKTKYYKFNKHDTNKCMHIKDAIEEMI